MQDRSYAIAIAVILLICCLGMYVAISGYMNSNPSPLDSLSATQSVPSTLVDVTINTTTPAPSKAGATSATLPTTAPVPSPLGAFQTITASATTVITASTATVPVKATVPSTAPSPAIPPSAAPQSCSGFAFCAKGGPPDSQLAPTGDPCPRNYVWGRVVDVSGKGIANASIRFKGPLGDLNTIISKGAPDPAGIYNIPAPTPGGNWTVWLLDAGGAQASPQLTVVAPQAYLGSGNCPTRVDFVAQK